MGESIAKQRQLHFTQSRTCVGESERERERECVWERMCTVFLNVQEAKLEGAGEGWSQAEGKEE